MFTGIFFHAILLRPTATSTAYKLTQIERAIADTYPQMLCREEFAMGKMSFCLNSFNSLGKKAGTCLVVKIPPLAEFLNQYICNIIIWSQKIAVWSQLQSNA